MRVALVHDFLVQNGGAEKVLLKLHEMWPEAPIFTLFYDKKKVGPYFKDCIVRVSPIQNLPLALKFYRLYLPLMPSAIERFNLDDFDLVISNVSAFAKGVITQSHTLHLSYIHCPTRYLWSDTHNYLDSLKGVEKVLRKVVSPVLTNLRLWDFQAAQRPNFIFSNSQNIAQEVEHYYHRKSEVLYPPINTQNFFVSQKPDKYFLLISRLRSYKKIDLAIEAFNHLGLPLKIIGTGELAACRKLAKKNIEFLGYLEDKERNQYLANCQALVFPQKEDFGLTAVESLASGRPVIAFRAGGALEIVQENINGIFFDEQNWQSLAGAVTKFQKQSENFNSQVIRQTSLKFDQANFEKTLRRKIQELC